MSAIHFVTYRVLGHNAADIQVQVGAEEQSLAQVLRGASTYSWNQLKRFIATGKYSSTMSCVPNPVFEFDRANKFA